MSRRLHRSSPAVTNRNREAALDGKGRDSQNQGPIWGDGDSCVDIGQAIKTVCSHAALQWIGPLKRVSVMAGNRAVGPKPVCGEEKVAGSIRGLRSTVYRRASGKSPSDGQTPTPTPLRFCFRLNGAAVQSAAQGNMKRRMGSNGATQGHAREKATMRSWTPTSHAAINACQRS